MFRWSVKGVDGSLETRLRAARALREKRYAAMLPRALRVSLLGCFAPQMVADKRRLLGMKHDNVSEVKCTAIAVPRACIGRFALTPDRLMIKCAEVGGGEWLCHPADLPFKVSRLSRRNIHTAPSAKRSCGEGGAVDQVDAQALIARSPARFEQLMAIARWRAEWLRAASAKQDMDIQRAESLMDKSPWALGRRSVSAKFVALWSRRCAEETAWQHHCSEVRLCSLLSVR